MRRGGRGIAAQVECADVIAVNKIDQAEDTETVVTCSALMPEARVFEDGIRPGASRSCCRQVHCERQRQHCSAVRDEVSKHEWAGVFTGRGFIRVDGAESWCICGSGHAWSSSAPRWCEAGGLIKGGDGSAALIKSEKCGDVESGVLSPRQENVLTSSSTGVRDRVHHRR